MTAKMNCRTKFNYFYCWLCATTRTKLQ